jgi:hypothetical protein
MLDLDGLRKQVAARLNVIRCRHDETGLFGAGTPLGRYDGAIFAYFTGTGKEEHPITALAYLRLRQNPVVAGEVLRITLEELAGVQDGLTETGRRRLELWRAAPAHSCMALAVPDEVAFQIIRPALDRMFAHYAATDYRHAVLVGQIVAWCLGDPLMERLPTHHFSLEVGMTPHVKDTFQAFTVSMVRTVYRMNGIENFHERMAALAN